MANTSAAQQAVEAVGRASWFSGLPCLRPWNRATGAFRFADRFWFPDAAAA